MDVVGLQDVLHHYRYQTMLYYSVVIAGHGPTTLNLVDLDIGLNGHRWIATNHGLCWQLAVNWAEQTRAFVGEVHDELWIGELVYFDGWLLKTIW